MRTNPQRFIMKRRHPLFGCVAIVSFFLGLSGMAGAAALPVAISAEFEHPPQGEMYRTLLSSVTPVSFTADQTGGMTALFLMEPADCFGIASWAAAGKQSKGVGPAVICTANSAVTEQEFNSWLDHGKKSVVDPRLIISLGPSQPGELIQPGQAQSQTRLNTSRVTAQIFLRGCDVNVFHKYGDLVFEKGKLAFTFWTDDQGMPQVNMSAAPVLLEKLNSDTWNLIRDGCDAAQALPPVPADGQSASFTGSSLQQPPDPSTLSGQIGLLVGQINSLVYQQQLGAKAAGKLLRWLDQTVTSLQRARPDQAVHELQKFRQSLTTLGKQSLIDPAAAASLAKGALGIEIFLTSRVNLEVPPPDPIHYCTSNDASCPDSVSSCEFTSWHVDGAFIDPAPDGSPKHPFPSITGALTQAAKVNLCGVTLNVAPARYAGPLEITRHTRIIGRREPISTTTFPSTIIEGSVSNQGPYLLEIASITLSWSREEVANGVFVDHPCAMTRLDSVAVLGYRGFGVRQRGGSLLSQRTIVMNTRAHPDFLAQGTGILLTCGVIADLSDVVLDSNESAGLLMAGTGTEVQAINLVVRGTRVNPALTNPAMGGPWGAVHVRDEARLTATSFYISDNWGLGIAVYNDAEADLDHGIITDTVNIGRFIAGLRHVGGGTGALARWGGHLRMSNFISTRNDLCGVAVTEEGALDLSGIVMTDSAGHFVSSTSDVTHSSIGACVAVDGYDVARLTNGVSYHDNGVNLQATTPPLPDVLGGLTP